MRKPRPGFSPIHACLFQAHVKALSQSRGLPTRVGEDEHADRASLLVADGLEQKPCRECSLLAKDASDRVERLVRLASEECERDVEARRRPAAREMVLAPCNELLDNICRKLESEEEPEPVISLDGSAITHWDVCQDSNNRRTR